MAGLGDRGLVGALDVSGECERQTFLAVWDYGTEEAPDVAIWAMCEAADKDNCGYVERHSDMSKGIELQNPGDWSLTSGQMARYVENHRLHSRARP